MFNYKPYETAGMSANQYNLDYTMFNYKLSVANITFLSFFI